MFDNKAIIQDAQRHASECYPEESCGFVVDGQYLPRKNCHETPTTNFRVSPSGYVWATRKGEIQAVVHSHPDGPAHPSRLDMELQQKGGLPWLIVPTNDRPFWFGDQAPIPPYLGRTFRCGVTDCYSIVRDWYRQEKGILLMDLPRDLAWWNNGESLYMDNFEAAGFRQLGDREQPEQADVLLASVNSPIVNHSALYLGNNQFMHHMPNRLSSIDLLSSWRKAFTIKMRYEG